MEYLRYYLGASVVLIGIVGFVLGGHWVWLAIGTYAPLALADGLLGADVRARRIASAQWADAPLYLHCALMVLLWGAVVLWARKGMPPLVDVAGAVAGLAWLGAVPNLPVNHELMHRRGRLPRALARFLGVFYGDPTRDIAHVHGHHLLLATELDADTARRGDTMYGFAFRCTRRAILESWKAECQRLQKRDRGPWHVENAVLQGHAAVLGVIIVSTILGGFVATLVIGSGILASRLLVEMFNYYQHYGLVRVVGTAYDRRHLWNHLSPVSRLLGFEITNHSDHHMDAFIPYYRLQPDPAGPQMPSIFICFLAGLVPPIWFRWVAMPRLAHWDARFASEEERRLARAANRRAGWPNWLEDSR